MKEFIRSSHCDTGSCVEVSVNEGKIVIRNSKEPSTFLEFTPAEWSAFIGGVQDGEFRRHPEEAS